MSRFKLGVVIFILATALSTATYAAKGGGGGGHGMAAAEVEATAAVVDMLVAAADMPAAATRAQPAVAAATRALPAAVARVTSAPDRLYPVRLRGLGRAPIDLPPCTLPRTMPSAERRRSMQPGTQRAMQTGP